jgi:hypothetical protein
MLRLAAGPGFPDTDALMAHEPVANREYSNVVGEFKGPGINNLSEEDMSTLTHKIEEILPKGALGNEGSSQWATEKMEKNKILLSEREEKERNDTPKENEGKLIPQIGLSKYEQSIGPKRRRGTAVIMVADGEDVDHLEAAYEALATRKTVSVGLKNSTITLNMSNKEDKAKRDMLTQKENEVQDNINVQRDHGKQEPIQGHRIQRLRTRHYEQLPTRDQ